ncbi:argonaute/piwi family protein [Paraburkholderia unamae]|uniref:Protein argonaute n=1 Tax=Paraburkholderia unamae TaxID=219649 RepID=A0ABX5KVG7_9BURK|nr:Piwi domain-containing protein [Paraburkholderia unamae]PVX97665.1 argonaute-like protein [Paraburkholderia unamae]
MLLNHLPISFSSQAFSGYLIPYTDADQLRALRRELRSTHFCLRVGDQIAQFPYPAVGKSKGTPRTFDITEDHAIANALARNALLRSFFNNSRQISGLRPVRFVNTTKNLLSGPESDTFSVLPEYSFDVRPLAPQDGALINGVVINFGARLLVRPTAAALHKRGASLVGLYLLAGDETDDPYILPMFDRKLAGRVVRVEDGYAFLDDCRVDRIALDAAWVEPSTATFERLGGQLLGNRYKAFQHELQTCISKISGAEQQLARLKKMFEFKDIQGELVACNGLTIQLDGHLTEVQPGMGVGMSRRFPAPQCSLRPGGSITVPWPVDPQIESNGPFDCDSFERKRVTIGFIFPAEHSGHVEQFGATLRDGMPSNGKPQPFSQGLLRKFRLQSVDLAWTPVKSAGSSSRASTYKEAALETARRGVDVAIVVITENDKGLHGADSPYYVAKAALMSQGIPVQMVRIETILQPPGSLAFTLTNIAVALYAKLGGIPWTLALQQKMVHEVIVGIGSARVGFDRLSERERLVGITTVFSGDGNYLLGNATAEVEAVRYQEALLASLEASLAELRRRFGWQKGDRLRIVFHQSFKRYKDSEAAAVSDLVKRLSDFQVEYAFVQVSDEHDWKLFDPTSEGVAAGRKVKGVAVPDRGQIVPLGPYAALVTLTGPRQLKSDAQGCPRPVLVAIHRDSTFQSLDYIAKQVFDLSFMSWRTVMPSSRPVSISYPNFVVQLLGNLRQVPNWNPDILTTRLRESRWFL